MRLPRGLVLPLFMACLACEPGSARAGAGEEKLEVSVEGYDPYGSAEEFENLVCFRLMREEPRLKVKPYVSLQFTGDVQSQYMAFAGGTAPDVKYVQFHELRTFIRQGFLCPLNEFLGEDRNGNGILDDQEVRPEVRALWKNIPKFYRQVATVDGKVYALPTLVEGMGAILYRKDLFRRAGLDPERPPRNWEELLYYAQKLTDPELQVAGAAVPMGQRGMLIEPRGWRFVPFIWAAGGEVMKQDRTGADGQPREFLHDATDFLIRDAKGELLEDLTGRAPAWRFTYADAGGRAAVQFYHRLAFQRWVREPQTGEPVNLSAEEALAGEVRRPDGSTLKFDPKKVIQGVVRVNWGQGMQDTLDLLRRGEVAMAFHVCEPKTFRTLGLPPESFGLFAVPPSGPGGRWAMLGAFHWRALNARLAEPGQEERRAMAWRVLSTLNGPAGARLQVEYYLKNGLAQFLDPDMLRRYGFESYLDWVPKSWQENYRAAKVYMRPEPYEGIWRSIAADDLGGRVAEPALMREDFDGGDALRASEERANKQIGSNEERIAAARPYAWALAGVWIAVLLGLAYLIFRSIQTRARREAAMAGGAARRSRGLLRRGLPWLLLAPALLLLAVFAYYPLARGTLISFQDYKICAPSRAVGLDNYTNVFVGESSFFEYLWVTVKFVALSLGFGFVAPIGLALLLHLAPRGKTFWRTVFFLPQVTSLLIAAFLWKLLYTPSPCGFLNKVLMAAGLVHQPVDWLGNVNTALLAVVLPAVWFGMGIGSLIYLAALKSIPDELYEAADLDGAGLWHKLRHITLPALAPLILINFIGAFIGTFHSMSNIFALTGGGPEKATHVLSLEIWYQAFAYLNFGFATALAWILGSLLLGFTLLQIRLLGRMEFRRAEAG